MFHKENSRIFTIFILVRIRDNDSLHYPEKNLFDPIKEDVLREMCLTFVYNYLKYFFWCTNTNM